MVLAKATSSAPGKAAKVKSSVNKGGAAGVKSVGITKSVTKRKPTDGLAAAVKAVAGAAKPAKKSAAPASQPASAKAASGKRKPAAQDESPPKRKQALAEQAFGTSSSEDDESDLEAGSDAKMSEPHAAVSGRSEAASGGALSNFRLSPQTVDALAGRGITSLFAIQAATFDIIFDGSDLIGRAHTGMGKTLAFALPTIERILLLKRSDRSLPHPLKPLALVLAPTRELAQQVGRELAAVAPSLACACVYGGAPIGQQCSDLRRGIDVLIGTPGRVKDLANRGALELDHVRLSTLDEADQMLDMGFAEDMADILGRCSHPDRQTCLFSATLPPWVVQEAPKYMRPNPRVVDLVGADAKKASSDVRHLAIPSPGPMSMRSSTINDVIAMYTSSSGRVIVFCGTKAECDDLTNSEALRYEAKCLHGDIPQAVREKTMAAFRTGKFRVLIATDVAARGLDMVVDLVLCAKPPMRMRSMRPDEETYVHRSGRTGRAGRKGICVTLYGPRDREAIEQIERFTKNQFEWLQPPNPKTLVLTAADTASADAAAIPEAAAGLFRTAAAQLLESKGGDAVAAVAAALALATNTTDVPPARSLLSSQDGYVTMQATMRSDVNNPSFVWGALRKVLPAGATDGTDNVRGLRLTADGHGAVFDLKESLFKECVAPVLDSNNWLTVVDDLPELSTPPDTAGKSYGKGGGKGGKGGGYGDSWGNRGGDSWGGGGGGGGGWGGKGGGRGGGGWGGGSPGGGRGGKGGGSGGGKGGRGGYGGGRGRW